ncbi:MAG: hypothetical protein ACREUD_03445 [Gammaproteobacteria bacterium]
MAIIEQYSNIVGQQNVSRQLDTLRETDIYIQPELGDISTSDFNRAAETIGLGADAARTEAAKLAKLAITSAAYSDHLAARSGPRRYAGDGEVRIGDPATSDFDFDSAEAYLRLYYDSLDNRNWPRSGALGSLEWIESVESLGADADFSQLLITGVLAHSFEKNTFVGGFEFDYTAGAVGNDSIYLHLGRLFCSNGRRLREAIRPASDVPPLIYNRQAQPVSSNLDHVSHTLFINVPHLCAHVDLGGSAGRPHPTALAPPGAFSSP